MPQLPTTTAEEYGADDEVKQYYQEDENSDTSTVDVLNDIKDDLLNEDSRDGGGTAGDDSLYQARSVANGYTKGLIVRPSLYRYSDQLSSYIPYNQYGSDTRMHMPMYSTEEKPYYGHGMWPSQAPMVTNYAMHYGPGGMAQKYGYHYPSGVPPGMSYYGPGGIGYAGISGRPPKAPKPPRVKKPLNAFMLYMKEQRPNIAAEFTLKESAAINQILGKRWHLLEKSEQAKYYEMARKERALHMQLYPGWNTRDNYSHTGRKKKKPRDKNEELNPKKCRARYGLDCQEQWCKPCRRKKKCIRFIIGADGETVEVIIKEQDPSDSDNENKVPASDVESKESKDCIKELVENNALVKLSINNNNNTETCTTSASPTSMSTVTSNTTTNTNTSTTTTNDKLVHSPKAEPVSAANTNPSNTHTSSRHTETDLDSKALDIFNLLDSLV